MIASPGKSIRDGKEFNQFLNFKTPDVASVDFDVAFDTRPDSMKDLSPQEFAKLGNQITQSNKFDFGDTNFVGRTVKRGSELVNILAGFYGARQAGTEVGGALGSLVGKTELGRETGDGVGRGVFNMIPLLLSGGVAGLGGAALLGGSQSFEETNDSLRATVAGAANLLAPAVVGKLTPLLGRTVLGKGLSDKVGSALTSGTALGVSSRFTGNLVDSLALDTVADVADIALADDRSFSELGTSDYWTSQAIGNLAFAPFDVKQAVQAQKVGGDVKVSSSIDDAIAIADAEQLRRSREDNENSPIIKEDVETIPSTSTFNGQDNVLRGSELEPLNEVVDFNSLEGPEFDLPSKVQSVRDVANTTPETVSDFNFHVESINEYRRTASRLPISDFMFKNSVELTAKEVGTEAAINIELQKAKNDVLISENVKPHNETQRVVKVIEQLEGSVDPAALSIFKRRVNLNGERPGYLDKSVTAFEKWSLLDDGDVAKLSRRLDNVKKQVSRTESNLNKTKKTPGRKPVIKDEDFSRVFDKVEELDKELRDSSVGLFTKFLDDVSSFSNSPTVANSGAKVLHQWLNRKDGKVEIGKLRGMFSKETQRLKLNANKDKSRFEEYKDEFYSDNDGRAVRETFEDDYDGRADFKDRMDQAWDANDGRNLKAAELVMLRSGRKPSEAASLAPEVLKIVRTFEELTGQRIEVGKLLNTDGTLSGLSSRSKVQNAVFIDPKLTKDLSQFVAAHEILGHQYKKLHAQGLLSPAQMKSYDRALDYMTSLTKSERVQVLSQLTKEFLPKRLHDTLDNTYKNSSDSVDEVMSNLAGIMAFASKNKQDIGSVAMFMPQRVYDHMVEAARFLKSVVGSIKSFAGLQRLRGIDVTKIDDIAQFKKDISETVGKFEKQDAESKKAFQFYDTVQPGGMGRLWSDISVDARKLEFNGNVEMEGLADAMFLTSKSAKKFVSEFAEGNFHYLERFKDLKRVALAVRTEKPMQHSMQRTAEALLYAESISPDGNVKVGKDLGVIGRLVKDPKANNVFDDIVRYQQKEDVNFFTLRNSDPDLYNRMLSSLNDKQKAVVTESLARVQKLTNTMQEEIINTNRYMQRMELATVLRKKVEGTNKQVKEFADQVHEMHRNQDPRVLDVLTERGIDPKSIITFLDDSTAAINKKQRFYSTRSHYVTERRMKQYQVSFSEKPGEATGLRDFDTEKEARSFVKEAQAKGMKLHYDGLGFKDTFRGADGRVKQTDAFEEALELADSKTTTNTIDALLADGSIDADTHQKLVQSRKEFKDAVNTSNFGIDIGNIGVKRDFKPGRENLNMLEQQIRYVTKLTNTLPRAHTDATLRFESLDPEIVNSERNSEAMNNARRGLANQRAGNTKLGNAITKGNFLHFLAFNVSSSAIELTQFPANLSPKLVEEGASIVQSYKLPVKAADSISKFNVSGEWSSGKTVRFKGKDVDLHQMLIDRAEREGRIGLGAHQEVQEAQVNNLLELGRMAKGSQPLGAKALTTVSGSLMHLASKMYGIFPGFNEKIGIISGAEFHASILFKDKKSFTEAEFNQLYDEGNRISGIANSSFGTSDTPVGLFEGNRTFAQSMWSLASFSNGLLSNLYRYTTKGLGRNIEGLTPKERTQARKAAAMSFGTLMGMTGIVGGIPLAGAITFLLEEHTEFEPSAAIREGLQELEKEITGNEGGTFLADAGSHGLAYALGAPFDMSSRVAVGGIFGVNSFEGWSPSALLGPTVSRASDYGTAATNAFNGDVNGAVEKVLPIGVRKLYNLWLDNGDITDSEGRTILKPTTAEQISQAIGIKPTRITANRELQNLTRIQTRNRQARNKRITLEVDELLRNEGPQAAQQRLAEYVRDNPGYEPSGVVRGVAQLMNDRQQGRDPRMTGTLQGAQQNANLVNTFNPELLTQQSLVTNARNKIQVAQQLGLQTGREGNDLAKAFITDTLRRRSNAPVPVLSQLAGGFLGGGSRFQGQQGQNLLDVYANTSPSLR